MKPQNTNPLQFLSDDVNTTPGAVTQEAATPEPLSPVELPSQQQAHAARLPPAAALDEAHLQSLFAVMRREQRRERLYRLSSLAWAIIYFAVWLPLRRSHTDDILDRIVNLSVMIYMVAGTLLNSKARKKAVKALTELEDIRAVGPLADALGFQTEERKPQIKEALIALLPRLQATDAAMLTAQQRNNLRKAVLGSDTRLVIAILKAYEQIGDSRDLAVVESLANRKRKITNLVYRIKIKLMELDSDPIRTAALACLPFLQANAERERAATTLLRASDAISATPDTLLRPAGGAPTPAIEQLLRMPNEGNDRGH